jgi:hypothetical protein
MHTDNHYINLSLTVLTSVVLLYLTLYLTNENSTFSKSGQAHTITHKVNTLTKAKIHVATLKLNR